MAATSSSSDFFFSLLFGLLLKSKIIDFKETQKQQLNCFQHCPSTLHPAGSRHAPLLRRQARGRSQHRARSEAKDSVQTSERHRHTKAEYAYRWMELRLILRKGRSFEGVFSLLLPPRSDGNLGILSGPPRQAGCARTSLSY